MACKFWDVSQDVHSESDIVPVYLQLISRCLQTVLCKASVQLSSRFPAAHAACASAYTCQATCLVRSQKNIHAHLLQHRTAWGRPCRRRTSGRCPQPLFDHLAPPRAACLLAAGHAAVEAVPAALRAGHLGEQQAPQALLQHLQAAARAVRRTLRQASCPHSFVTLLRQALHAYGRQAANQ